MIMDQATFGNRPLICSNCKIQVVKAIVIIGQGTGEELVLCRDCAQHLMRILLEDIISYDNNQQVSLLKIMFHGGRQG